MVSLASGPLARSVAIIFFLSSVSIISMFGSSGSGDGVSPQSPPPSRLIDTEEVDIGMDIPSVDPQYMIICPAIFKEECIPLAIHRTEMGLPTVIYGLEDIYANTTGRDMREKVHNFLIEFQNRYPSFNWLLIMGDSEFIRPMELWHYAEDRSQPFGNTYHSDVYYAGLDSDWDDDGDGKYGEVYFDGQVEADTDWDLYVGRVPASTEQHVIDYIEKLIAYERNPPVGTWMKRFNNWGSVMEPPNRVNVPDDPNNYFAYKSNAYKVCQKINDDLPEHIVLQELYDYPELEPGNYSVDDGRDTLNRQNMLSQFNMGSSMLNFAGQARYQAYALNDYGPPYGDGFVYTWNEPMTYRDPGNFTNGGMLPLMYASTCDTAKFFQTGQWEDKSLETWVTAGNGGVIGLISSTNVSARGEQKNLSWGNWYLDERFWERFLQSGETRPAKTLYNLKEEYEEEWYSPTLQIKETIMGMIYAYILLGDPYVDIYTDVAERFPTNLPLNIDIYQGNHSVRFTVIDRNGDPVPGAKVNIYSHSTYVTFIADSEGRIDRTFDPMGDGVVNMTISAHNMVTRSYQITIKDEIADLVIEEETITIPSGPYEHGENISIGFSVSNHGGLMASSTIVKVESSFDDGDNWTLSDVISVGDVPAGASRQIVYYHICRAGNENIRFSLFTISAEIDLLNNGFEVEFPVPEPRLLFELGTGAIRPTNVVRPGSNISIEYDVFNEGPGTGILTLQLFLGDPALDGIALTDPIVHGTIDVNSWGNGSIAIDCPEETSLIYIVMDPEGEYLPHITDDPVKALVEINMAPRITKDLSLIILEDSGMASIRIDDAFDDTDNTSSDLTYSIGTCENITCEISNDANGTYAEVTPADNWYGNISVPVRISDGLGSITEILEISVLPVNDAPYFVNMNGDQIRLTMVEDSEFSIFIQAEDLEGDVITFSSEGSPFGLDPETGQLTWKPAQEDVGLKLWTITVTDPYGGSTSADLVIEVLPNNDPPVIVGLEDIVVEYESIVKRSIQVEDEEGDPISILPSHGFVDILRNELIVIEWEEGHDGPINVTLEISDGVNTIYAYFTVEFEEPPGNSGDVDGRSIELETLMIGAGIAIAFFTLLFLLFTIARKNHTSNRVDEERAAADALYIEDMDSIEE